MGNYFAVLYFLFHVSDGLPNFRLYWKFKNKTKKTKQKLNKRSKNVTSCDENCFLNNRHWIQMLQSHLFVFVYAEKLSNIKSAQDRNEQQEH